MALSAFDDKSSPAEDRRLREVLGRTAALWFQLKTDLAAEFTPLDEKWTYSGKPYGWSLRLKQKKRTVVYLVPQAGCFLAAFALGEKACLAAQESGLPASILETIERAPRYAEGRAVRLEVRTRKDLVCIKKLAAIKMAH